MSFLILILANASPFRAAVIHYERSLTGCMVSYQEASHHYATETIKNYLFRYLKQIQCVLQVSTCPLFIFECLVVDDNRLKKNDLFQVVFTVLTYVYRM